MDFSIFSTKVCEKRGVSSLVFSIVKPSLNLKRILDDR